MTGAGDLNLRWAWSLIDGLAAAGVRDAVISPGSRSTPLALACARHPAVTVRIQTDERSAAFLALGLGRGGRPAMVIATSGSAPAHWHPAVLEAFYDGVPLVLLSADRPPELRGWGANQTIDQTRLFGPHVREFHELPTPDASLLGYARALGVRAARCCRTPQPGPVHLNLPLREPLVPATEVGLTPGPSIPADEPASWTPAPSAVDRWGERLSGRPGVIVAGRGAGDPSAVAALADRLQVPLFADPLSGLRFGPHHHRGILTRYDAFLHNRAVAEQLQPEWVLTLGKPPISKTLGDWLAAQPAGRRVGVAGDDTWPDPHHNSELIQGDPALFCRALAEFTPEPAPGRWLDAFTAADARCAELGAADPPPEAAVVKALCARLAGGTLFCGNSMPVREVDSWSGCGSVPLTIAASRGTSGIDGGISTLLGLAAARPGPVAGLLGDLAFGHDLNGLAAAEGIDATLVVLNNGGGAIFGYLPQARLPEFEPLWLTPPRIDIGAAAATFGVAHRRTEADGLADALAETIGQTGLNILEVMIDREASRTCHLAYWRRVAAADLTA